jgi:hypothetical protein
VAIKEMVTFLAAGLRGPVAEVGRGKAARKAAEVIGVQEP